MSARVSGSVLFVLVLAAGCSGGARAPERAPAEGSAYPPSSVEILPGHVGKRVRVVLKPGTQTLTGKLVALESSNDTATLETSYRSWISFRPSHVTILEVLPEEEDEHAAHRDPEPARPARLTLAPPRKEGDGFVDTEKVRLVVVDFTKEHRLSDCLLDLAEPLQKAPSTVVFQDGKSAATLRVPVPEDPQASLLPFSWHVHVISGTDGQGRDRFFAQNMDGDVVIGPAELQEARQLVLVGTPHRVEKKTIGIDAVVPPRMIAIDVVEAGKAPALLEINPALVSHTDTGLGRLYTAAQPMNDSEMILSTYDPERRSSLAMPKVRYSVQDAVLYPAWTLEVRESGQDERLWQRLGGYPVPPYLSFETPETTRVTLEIGETKKGDFPAPPQVFVRAPETVLVKAELDVRYAGLRSDYAYKMILAHGAPHDPDKKRLYNPAEGDITAERRYEAREIDLRSAPRDTFPCQVFVWYQLSAAWKKTGGFMAGSTPMAEPSTPKAPTRRRAHYPAPNPGVRFITFTGPRMDHAAAVLPAALGAKGMGGGTLGTGGPYVPFSPMIGTSNIIDRGAAYRPISMAAASPHLCTGPVWAGALANSGAGASAIAICNGGGGGGGGGCEDKSKGGKGEPADKPEKLDRPSRPDVPTIDRFNPDFHTPMTMDSVSGWK